MRRDDLVGADIADADRLGDEADDVDRWPENGEAADDATERPGRNVAVPVEQPYGFVQIELDGGGRGGHSDYITPQVLDRYGCPTSNFVPTLCSSHLPIWSDLPL